MFLPSSRTILRFCILILLLTVCLFANETLSLQETSAHPHISSRQHAHGHGKYVAYLYAHKNKCWRTRSCSHKPRKDQQIQQKGSTGSGLVNVKIQMSLTNVDSLEFNFANATCAPGTTLIGGGFRTAPTTQLFVLTDNGPGFGNNWIASGYNGNAKLKLTLIAYAFCAS